MLKPPIFSFCRALSSVACELLFFSGRGRCSLGLRVSFRSADDLVVCLEGGLVVVVVFCRWDVRSLLGLLCRIDVRLGRLAEVLLLLLLVCPCDDEEATGARLTFAGLGM